ncbi:unnamed protein product [Pedinophyceae sp. YPF-701]|nr:unnamed protein product [Pedinophyceae sp. YPF-701]
MRGLMLGPGGGRRRPRSAIVDFAAWVAVAVLGWMLITRGASPGRKEARESLVRLRDAASADLQAQEAQLSVSADLGNQPGAHNTQAQSAPDEPASAGRDSADPQETAAPRQGQKETSARGGASSDKQAVAETAVCVAGTLRTLAFRGVYKDIIRTLIEPLKADVFMDLELDLQAFGRSEELQMKDLDVVLGALPEAPKGMRVDRESRWQRGACTHEGMVLPPAQNHEPHNCEWKDLIDGKTMRGHDRGAQYWRVRACFELIDAYERKAGGRYKYIVRQRTDVRTVGFPSLVEMRAQLQRAMNAQGKQEACLVPFVNVPHGTIKDQFAVCTRGGGEHYMRVGDDLMDSTNWTELACPADPWDQYACECTLGEKLRRANVALADLQDYNEEWTRICGEGFAPPPCSANNDFIVDTARQHGVTLERGR